jgi:hypothetical protein
MRVEEWRSTEGRTEVHFFREKDDEYLFGYNPLLMPEELVDYLKKWGRTRSMPNNSGCGWAPHESSGWEPEPKRPEAPVQTPLD